MSMALFDEGNGGGGEVIGEKDPASLYDERLFPLATPAGFCVIPHNALMTHARVLRRSKGCFTVSEGANLPLEALDALALFQR